MIEFNLVWLITILLIVLSSVFFVVAGIILYKKNNNESFSFLKHFPSELNNKDNPRNNIYLTGLFMYAVMYFSILWNSLPFSTQFGSFIAFIIVGGIFGLLIGLSFILINFVEVKYTRIHTTVSTLYMISSFGLIAIETVFSFILYSINKSPLNIVTGIVGAILLLLQALIIFNPKLKDWAKLDSHTNKKGEIEFSRPKVFPLAYSEWATFILSTLGLILFLVSLL